MFVYPFVQVLAFSSFSFARLHRRQRHRLVLKIDLHLHVDAGFFRSA
jgi:hypothetical protein